jgi:hypothetical protein
MKFIYKNADGSEGHFYAITKSSARRILGKLIADMVLTNPVILCYYNIKDMTKIFYSRKIK